MMMNTTIILKMELPNQTKRNSQKERNRFNRVDPFKSFKMRFTKKFLILKFTFSSHSYCCVITRMRTYFLQRVSRQPNARREAWKKQILELKSKENSKAFADSAQRPRLLRMSRTVLLYCEVLTIIEDYISLSRYHSKHISTWEKKTRRYVTNWSAKWWLKIIKGLFGNLIATLCYRSVHHRQV